MKYLNFCHRALFNRNRLACLSKVIPLAFLPLLVTAADFNLTEATIAEINSAIDAGELSSSVYIYSLRAGEFISVKRLVLLK